MLKRKNKKGLECSVEEAYEVKTTRHEENVRIPDHQNRDINEAAKKKSRDHQWESSPRKKVEKSSRAELSHSENKERDHQWESSPRKKVEKSSRAELSHSENKERKKVEKSSRAELSHSENKERRDVVNSRDHQRESSPRKKVEKSSRVELSHSENKERRDVVSSRDHQRESSPSENKERRDVVHSRDHQRESSPRKKVEKSSRMELSHCKKYSRNHQLESSPRKKVEKSSRIEHSHSKSENNERRDVENKSKYKHDTDVKNASESKNDRQGRVRSKAEVHLTSDDKYNNETKHSDSAAHDRHVERNGGASERENKKRERSGDDEKYRLWDPVKKHDSGSRWDSEISERKEKAEPYRSHHDETRSKRRRSRSQERKKEKARKSSSSSPKAQKDVLDHVHDHIEPSSRSERDRSRRHSDVDRSKMPSDGSSSHHRRHGGSSSGLGGYSPRKRKSEAAVKTPSPIRSPERKNAGWDYPSSGADRNLSTTATGTQLVSQANTAKMIEFAAGVSVASTSSMGKPISAILSNSLSAFKQASIDSVQLTQATRPMRRLYIDNIPGSATEKDIMECFNTFLLSSGSNYIRGAHPCISCMIHKEKGQALVEFLTPEDASAALSFDGRSFCGSILKIRRPKDFVELPVRLVTISLLHFLFLNAIPVK
ncbi:Splicing factor U2af large subunit A [Bienertia sinuspersici]